MIPIPPRGISTEVALTWKRYAAGGPYDLAADGGGYACRSIIVLADGDLIHAVDGDGTDRPVPGLTKGMALPIAAKSITPTAAVLVLW